MLHACIILECRSHRHRQARQRQENRVTDRWCLVGILCLWFAILVILTARFGTMTPCGTAPSRRRLRVDISTAPSTLMRRSLARVPGIEPSSRAVKPRGPQRLASLCRSASTEKHPPGAFPSHIYPSSGVQNLSAGRPRASRAPTHLRHALELTHKHT